MLHVQRLSKSYGIQTVLADVSFVVNDGEHVGLIGPNGAGKSTLLRCIAGRESADAGTSVFSPPDTRIGYLPQALSDLEHRTVSEALDAASPEHVRAQSDLQKAADALAGPGDSAAALAAYDAALARFEALGGYDREQRAEEILQRLGLADLDRSGPAATLSGGQKTRLGLACLLLAEPDLLLLDEPTNHLDLDALRWLEDFVRAYPRAVLVVSHDREFLNRTLTRVLYLDPDAHGVKSYPGNYADFAAARAHERALHEEAWKRQEEYVTQVRQDVARVKGEALAIERGTTSRQPNVRRLARKLARLATSRERKLERYLESDERVEKPRLGWGLKLDFGPPPAGARSVLHLDDVTFAYPDRPSLLRDITLDVQRGERVALVGPNGAGKTTVLRLIAGTLAPTRGEVRLGASVRPGMMTQEQETLDPARAVLETALRERPMPETDARAFLHYFLFAGDDVFRPVGACSLGERSRLQLALLVLRGCDLLLLDEPLNHLDVDGREHFEEALNAFPGTVVVVTHDRAFLRRYPTRIVEVRDGQLRPFANEEDIE